MNRRQFLLATAASVAAGFTARAADAEPLRLTHTIALPGVKGRFDHFACDVPARRLILAALGNDTGEVLDVAEFKRLHTITGLRKPTGALVLSKPHQFYFANG